MNNSGRYIGELSFSDFIEIYSGSTDSYGPSILSISYNNPKGLTVKNIANRNKEKFGAISDKYNSVHINILATVVGIMVIFLIMLIFNYIYNRGKN